MDGHDEPLLEICRYLESFEDPFRLQFYGDRPRQQTAMDRAFSCRPGLQSDKVTLNVLGDRRPASFEDLPPLFFEESNYNVILELPEIVSGDAVDVEFPHGRISSRFHWLGEDKKVLSGVLRTRRRVGLIPFTFFYRDREILSVEIEVFPTKMDYRRDFRSMMDDITSIAYRLAFDFDRLSHLTARETDRTLPSDEEWFNILDNIFQQFKRAFEVIARNPGRDLETTRRMVRPARVRRGGKTLQKWIRTHQSKLESVSPSEGIVGIGGEDVSARRLPEERRRNTFDTPENRFLKHVVQQVRNRLRRFKSQYESATEGSRARSVNQELIDTLDEMYDSVCRLARYDFIQKASELRQRRFSSHVLQMAPGYRTIYKLYFLLQKGLELDGKVFELEPKDVSELYEYWCFLKLFDLINRQGFERVKNEVIQVSERGIRVTLSKGEASGVVFEASEDNEFRLYYNRSDSTQEDLPGRRRGRTYDDSFLEALEDEAVPGNPTGENRPDITFEMLKQDPAREDDQYPDEVRFVFDAKYDNETTRDELLGPARETVDTMHRYRDAMISELEDRDVPSRDYRKTINALVLFPLASSDRAEHVRRYQEAPHPFFRSIGEVGIGGLPFLPDTTELVEALMEDFLEFHPERFRDRRIRRLHPKEVEWYDERSRDVLVGVVPRDRQSERWKLIAEEGFYHIPGDEVNQRRASVDYLAFYFPQGSHANLDHVEREDGHIRYYAEVQNTLLVNRAKIPRMSSQETSEGPVLVYRLGPLESLDRAISNPHGDRTTFRFGTLYTLKRAETLPELYLTRPDQQREWRDLQSSKTDVRPRVTGWTTDELGNRDAEIEFVRLDA